jgi:zinc protease
MEIVIITDESEAENLAESLRKDKPSPMSYSNTLKASLPDDIFKEDNSVSTYPLNIREVRMVNSAETFMK